MSVMFKTQQGRTLYRRDLTVDDMTRAVGLLVEVTGHELGSDVEFHAHTRHIVEWWTPPSGSPLREDADG